MEDLSIRFDDDGFVILGVPMDWPEEDWPEADDENDRCACHAGKVCAYCLMREGRL